MSPSGSSSGSSTSAALQVTSGYRGWFYEQLAMYMAYHRNARNQATHHVGVPVIVFAIMMAFSQLYIATVGGFVVTGATLLLAVMALLYITAVPLIGLCTVIFYVIVYALAAKAGEGIPVVVWSVAAAAFIIGWIIQFVGHAFEGRRPAFITNIVQVLMAPPFLIAEFLFSRGLEQELKRNIEERSLKY